MSEAPASVLRGRYPELFRFIDAGECGLGYSPKVREFWLRVRDGEVVQQVSFCPFTGQALPSSLRTRYFDELEALGLDSGLADVDRAPSEFQSEAWWIGRNL